MVCLGGSAGGLQGYMDILCGLPADAGMAFVVAPHRAQENAELLPQIGREACRLPSVTSV